MPSSGIAGLRGTSTSDYAVDERPKSFREMILWRDPNGGTPLTALMSRMKTEPVDDPEFSWWEEELSPVRLQIAGAGISANVASTLITCYTTGDFTATDLAAGDLLLLETPTNFTTHWEIIEVATTPTASNVFSVVRQAAGTPLSSLAPGGWVVKIGSAFAEGADAAAATFRKPTKFTNYTEIFKTTYSISKSASKTKFRTGDPLKNERKRKSFYHAQQLEYAFLFGTPSETVGTASNGPGAGGRTSMPKRYTGGLWHFLRITHGATVSTLVSLNSATFTEDHFLDATFPMFDYGYTGAGNERIALCGNQFLNSMNKMVKRMTATAIQYNGSITAFGMKLQEYALPQGTIYFRTHPMLNVNQKFTKSAFFINPSGIIYRPLRGRDTDFEDNIQTPGADYFAGQWLTEAGVEFHHMRSMLYMELV
jgi:hypothetical protein